MIKEKNIYQIAIIILICFICFKCNRDTSITNVKPLNRKEFRHLLDSLKLSKRTKSVTIVNTQTKIKKKLETIVIHDTVYKAIVNEPFISGEIIATKDSFDIDLSIINEYTVSFEQKRGLFKKHPLEVKVTSLSPYTDVKVKHYYKDTKSPLIRPSIQFGVGIDLITKKPTVYAGFGVSVVF